MMRFKLDVRIEFGSTLFCNLSLIRVVCFLIEIFQSNQGFGFLNMFMTEEKLAIEITQVNRV